MHRVTIELQKIQVEQREMLWEHEPQAVSSSPKLSRVFL